ncbi:hypothetical protein AA0X95_02775 [Bacillus sp. 1P10SD]|uniref:hypothetical protein n=1 Tax=Bacillus sp. 1P10SD TaxID=3132265 RepID=UPI0039A52164
MTQIQFNLNIDGLKDSVMNSDIDAVIKASIVLVLNSVMEKERDEFLQAVLTNVQVYVVEPLYEPLFLFFH